MHYMADLCIVTKLSIQYKCCKAFETVNPRVVANSHLHCTFSPLSKFAKKLFQGSFSFG